MSNIEFQSAMENFSIMFPEMELDVIEEILRSNRGNVETTIDQLLTIASDNQNEKFMRDDDPSKAPVAVAAAPVTEKTKDLKSASSGDTKIMKYAKSSRQPVLLPLDPSFLRLTGELDELAVMLQNEEFLAELRFNQEFLSTLPEDEGRSFEERLKAMGKVSRKKFQQIHKMFTFQRKKNSTQKPKNKLLNEEDDDEGSTSKA